MALEDTGVQVDLAFTRDDPKGPVFENALAGAPSFLRRRHTEDLRGVDLVVTGVPFDQAASHRAGARFGPLALIRIDADSDLWPDDDLTRIDRGTRTWKAVGEGLIDPARSIRIGSRTDCEDYCGLEFIDARTVHERGVASVVEQVKARVGDAACYISFDIDALDPAYAPVTGTPVRGGLARWQAQAILRDLAGINLVGADVVEVSPPFDHASITAVAAAHVAMELICLYGWTRRKG